MPASLTPVQARTAITKPVGSDVFSLAALVGMSQSIADRTEWASKALIVPTVKTLNMGGNDYTDTTSFALVQQAGVTASFTLTVSVGDLVILTSDGTIIFNGAVNSSYEFEWHDGTAQISSVYLNKAAAWGVGESRAINLGAYYVVTSAGSMTFSLRGKRTGSTATPQGGTLRVGCIHVKLGSA